MTKYVFSHFIALIIRQSHKDRSSLEYAELIAHLGKAYFHNKSLDVSYNCLMEALKVNASNNREDTIDSANLHQLLGKILFSKGDHDKAMLLFQKSRLLCEKEAGADSQVVSSIALDIGRTFMKQCKVEAASEQFKKCLAIRKRYGKETMEVAEVLEEIGKLLSLSQSFTGGLDCFRQCLQIGRVNNDQLCIASSHHQMGKAFFGRKEFDRALDSFESSRQIYEEFLGCTCIEYGVILSDIGQVHDVCLRVNDALSVYFNACDILSGAVIEDPVTLSLVLHNTGMIYFKKQNFGKALEICSKALNIRKEKFPVQSIYLAESQVSVANIHTELDEVHKALPLFQGATDIYRHNKMNVEEARCLYKSGVIHMQIGSSDQAFALLSNAWRLHCKLKNNDSLEASSVLFELGSIHSQKHRLKEAYNFLTKCLKVRISHLDKNDVIIGKTCDSLGLVLRKLNRFDDALQVYTRAKEIYHNSLGEKDESYANMLSEIGTIYCHKLEYDLSLQSFEKARAIIEVRTGGISEEMATILLNMGKIHDLRVDNEEAMKCMVGALKIRTAIHGDTDVKVAETILKIARVLEDWGDSDEVSSLDLSVITMISLSNHLFLIKRQWNIFTKPLASMSQIWVLQTHLQQKYTMRLEGYMQRGWNLTLL